MMKKLSAVFIVMIGLSLSGCDACTENVFNKAGDTIATIGKEGLAKEKILAERKAARAGKCAEQKAGELKKKMGL